MKFKNNLIAFIVIGGLGSLFHFVYGWTNENMIVGLFFSVNESVWEHLKLIFYPALIYFTAEYFITKPKTDNYISQITVSIFYAMATTISLFYIYTGILGFNVDVINIMIFLLSVIVLIIKRNKIAEEEKFKSKNAKILFIFLLVITAFLFAVWSYNPPSLGIFTPPVI